MHTIAFPLALIAVGYGFQAQNAMLIGLIWLTHITWDRMLGYGLKLPTSFNDTHLGRIGRELNAFVDFPDLELFQRHAPRADRTRGSKRIISSVSSRV